MTVGSIENHSSFIVPQWPAPSNVIALSTTRRGGVSTGNYASFNLGLQVGDSPGHVERNHAKLKMLLGAEVSLQCLQQVHGGRVIEASRDSAVVTADASFTTRTDIACCVTTADCLPILISSLQGDAVAAVHAGWRGLAEGVLENTIARFPAAPAQSCAWMGPAIGICHFEVGAEVREIFLTSSSEDLRGGIERCFIQSAQPGKFFADLYAIARLKLNALGFNSIYGGTYCTHCDDERFYSFRRQPQTGRMTSLIYIKS